jgi:hypothetical protein
MFTRRAALAAAAGVAASRATDSWAQPAFPTRPATIVPVTPGSAGHDLSDEDKRALIECMKYL